MSVRSLSVGLLLLVGVACTGEDSWEHLPEQATPVVSFTDADGTLLAELGVEVANDPEERERGLMFVEELASDEGMAFVYDEPDAGTYWMKNTLIPLSIAFVGPDDRITTIRDMEPCPERPCPKYGADAPFVLAVEANQGWFADNGIETGDRAELAVVYAEGPAT